MPIDRLTTLCGVHGDDSPVQLAHYFPPRPARTCGLCLKIQNGEKDDPRGVSAALARQRPPHLDLTGTLDLLVEVQDGDRARMAAALADHASALISETKRQGIPAEEAFMRLAQLHGWGNNLRDALQHACSYAVQHPARRRLLLSGHAQAVERLRQGQVPRHLRVARVGELVYQLVSLLSLHNFEVFFLINLLDPLQVAAPTLGLQQGLEAMTPGPLGATAA
jgi:hypothetical protein